MKFYLNFVVILIWQILKQFMIFYVNRLKKIIKMRYKILRIEFRVPILIVQGKINKI